MDYTHNYTLFAVIIAIVVKDSLIVRAFGNWGLEDIQMVTRILSQCN